jgi:TP901 family phage tail tape measure protein
MADSKNIITIIAQLDKNASKKEIEASIKQIEKNLKLNLGIDSKSLSKANDDLKVTITETDKATKNITSFNTEIGKTVQITESINKKTKEVSSSIKAVYNTKDIEKHNKQLDILAQKMGTLREKSQTRVKKENDQLDISQLKAIESYKKEVFSKDMKRISEQRDAINRLNNTKAQEYQNNLNSRLGISSGVSRSAKDSASVFNDVFNKAKAGEHLDKQEKKVSKLADATKNLNKEQYNFANMLGEGIKKMAVWSIAATAFYAPIRALQSGIQYITELDKSLNQIRIVTGKSVPEVNELSKGYNNLAKQMGVTTKEISDTSVELYRQGLSQEQVNERLQAIIKYSKVASLSLQDSNSIITATMNSMNIGAERTIDVFSKLGDATATGADEIGRAMQKVGGTAGSMNVSLEKASSWIATISSKTREGAETIGNSVKSILSRYTQIKEKGLTDEDGTTVNQVGKALKAAKIQAFDQSTGTLRDATKVMDELGQKWNTLDTTTQNYIATTLAG